MNKNRKAIIRVVSLLIFACILEKLYYFYFLKDFFEINIPVNFSVEEGEVMNQGRIYFPEEEIETLRIASNYVSPISRYVPFKYDLKIESNNLIMNNQSSSQPIDLICTPNNKNWLGRGVGDSLLGDSLLLEAKTLPLSVILNELVNIKCDISYTSDFIPASVKGDIQFKFSQSWFSYFLYILFIWVPIAIALLAVLRKL